MKKNLFRIAILFYILITLIRVLNHQTWYDEARAWLIAENLNLFEIFDLMKVEGHTFVWYVLLMPFAKTHFAYPYSMLILNWLFCIAAIIIMWAYAPFNNLSKTLIMFSSPFFMLYPILARCYAVGIFVLFLLAAMYKDKLKHPYVYSILIFFCANTSVIAAVGAVAFAVLFLYEIIKTKNYKILYGCFVIGILCVTVILMQLYGASPSKALPEMLLSLDSKFFLNVFIFPQIVNLILLPVGIPFLLFMLFKEKESFSFLVITFFGSLVIYNYIYYGMAWHHYFFYIYLIIAGWLYVESDRPPQKYKTLLTVFLMIVSFFYCIDFRYRNGAYNSGSKYLAQKVINLKDSGIIFVGKYFFQLLPYIEDKNVDYYYAHTSKKIDNPIKEENNISKDINLDVVSDVYDKHKKTYLFLIEKDVQMSDFGMKNNNTEILFKLKEVFGKNVYIYEVQKFR